VLSNATGSELNIYIGSNDGHIYCYQASAGTATTVLSAHESTVCALNGLASSGILVSGSWDKSAIIWQGHVKKGKLEGHQAAVWSVSVFSEQCILTGSADKSIKVWHWNSSDGSVRCTATLDRHTDCVRDLKRVNDSQFLSCANDATIILWNLSGEVLGTYYGHENYIYSVVPLIGSTIDDPRFASCSEDKTLRIWRNGQAEQTIRLPAPTLWCVDQLTNGDLIVGASNGKVYVYTQNKAAMASAEERKQLEEELAKMALPMAELGDLDVKKLPGKDALHQPGDKDGKTKLIRDGDSIQAYQWNAAKFEWQKIGDVVGAANSNNDPSQKKEFEGKLYDFVFTVDIEDGAPPLRLPYNLDENPWQVAQEFIQRNELSAGYLDQVANFIVTNSQTTAHLNAPSGSTTGGANLDPLTGGSSYSTSKASSSGATATYKAQLNPEHNDYYPVTKYFLFETLNVEGVVKKIKEFRGKISADNYQLQDSHIASLVQLANKSVPPSQEHYEILKSLLTWPEGTFDAVQTLQFSKFN
jgi:phospholipase A-2-activating protein